MLYQLVGGVCYRGFRTGIGFGSPTGRVNVDADQVRQANCFNTPSREALSRSANAEPLST